MAVSSAPESTATTTTTDEQTLMDHSFSVRKRLNATSLKAHEHDFTSKGFGEEVDDLGKVSMVGDGVDENKMSVEDEDCDRMKRSSSDSVLRNAEAKVVNGGGSNEMEYTASRFAYRASSPAHRRIKESPLSSDAIFRQSHAGLFNLCIVVLVAVNSRLIIENLMKYGWLIRGGFWFSPKSLRDWPLLMCCLTLPIFSLAAFLVEKLAQQRHLSEAVIVSLHVVITTTSVFYPVYVILRCESAVLNGVALMLLACIVWLKLVSYAHTNYDMRCIAKASVKENSSLTQRLPYDVSFKSLAYFMVAPTLCYQVTEVCGIFSMTIYQMKLHLSPDTVAFS
ncbi:hypothetical protein Dimus_026098 [Dionaea muscipula]